MKGGELDDLRPVLRTFQEPQNSYVVVIFRPVQIDMLGQRETRAVRVRTIENPGSRHRGTSSCPVEADDFKHQGSARVGRMALKHSNSLQGSLCPVVICPYLCSSEMSLSTFSLAPKQEQEQEPMVAALDWRRSNPGGPNPGDKHNDGGYGQSWY